jgi:hypothetical protein
MLVCKGNYEMGGGRGVDMIEEQVGFAYVRRSVEPRNAQPRTPDVFTFSQD